VRGAKTGGGPDAARRAELLVAAACVFVILTAGAMLAYPGGARFHHHSRGYMFLQNFISDLGASRTYSGRANATSQLLFVVALGLLGLAMIGFSTTWRTIWGRREQGRRFGGVAQAAAVASGVALVGVAVTRWNRGLGPHSASIRLVFGALLVLSVSTLALQLRNAWPAAFVAVNALSLLVLVVYELALFAGPGTDTQSGLEFQVALQKLVVYTAVVNIAVQAFAVRREALALDA
jgi:hypothetical membrane protein